MSENNQFIEYTRWLLCLLLKIVAIAGMLTLTVVAAFFIQEYVKTLPSKKKSYMGVGLSMSKEEVMYVLGTPTLVLGDYITNERGDKSRFREIIYLDEPKNQYRYRPSDSNAWDYEYYNQRIHLDRPRTKQNWEKFQDARLQTISVRFDFRGNVKKVSCTAEYSCEDIAGLNIGSPEEEVYRRMGKPSKETVENGIKSLTYNSYNVFFELKKKHIYKIGIEHFSDGPLGNNETTKTKEDPAVTPNMMHLHPQ